MDHRRLSASPPPLHDHPCWTIQCSQSWNGEGFGLLLDKGHASNLHPAAHCVKPPRRLHPIALLLTRNPVCCGVTFIVMAGLVPAIGRGTLPLRMAGTSPGTSPAMTVRAGTVRAGFIQGGSANGRWELATTDGPPFVRTGFARSGWLSPWPCAAIRPSSVLNLLGGTRKVDGLEHGANNDD